MEPENNETLPIESEEREVTLDEIFDMNPLAHTPEQRDLIIAAMIDKREEWFHEESLAQAERRPVNWRKKGVQTALDLSPTAAKARLGAGSKKARELMGEEAVKDLMDDIEL